MDTKLEVEITCHICRRLPREPRLLACLHSFCRRCIASKIEESHQQSRDGTSTIENPSENGRFINVGVICPVCSHATEFDISSYLKDVSYVDRASTFYGELAGKLRENVVAKRLLRDIRDHQERPSQSSGDIQLPNANGCTTGHNQVVSGVNVDNPSIEVRGAHGTLKIETRVPQQQTLTDYGSFRSGLSQYESCQLHDGERKKYFCKACEISVCASCVILDHGQSRHEWCSLTEAAAGLQDTLGDILEEAKTRLEDIDEQFTLLEEKIKRVPERMQDFRDDIEETCDIVINTIVKLIESRRNTLLEKIKALEKSSLEELDEAKKEGQVIHARLARIAEYGHNVKTRGSPTEILEWKASLQDTISSVPVDEWFHRIQQSGGTALDPELRFDKINLNTKPGSHEISSFAPVVRRHHPIQHSGDNSQDSEVAMVADMESIRVDPDVRFGKMTSAPVSKSSHWNRGSTAMDRQLRLDQMKILPQWPDSNWCNIGCLVHPGNWQLVNIIEVQRPLGDLITAIAALEDGLVAVGFQMNGVRILDARGNPTNIFWENTGRVVDLVPMGGDKLAMLNAKGTLNILQPNDRILEIENDTNGTQQHLRCLTATKDGMLVVGVAKQKRIYILNDDGSLIDTIGTNKVPHRLACSSDHIALVHNQVTVSIIDMDGNLQCTIDNKDWAYASVCASPTHDSFFVLSAKKKTPKLLTIQRWGPDGRLLETVVANHPIKTLGWLNPRLSVNRAGQLVVCAEDEIVTFEREFVVLDNEE